MKPNLIGGGAAFLIACATPAFAQTDPLQATLDQLRESAGIPALGGAIVTADGLLWSGVCGVRRQGSPDPVTLSDRWHLGSNTKAMTAVLYASLVDSGRARWGATVPELFADLTLDSAWTTTTIEQLLGHRAGVLDQASFDAFCVTPVARIVELVRSQRPEALIIGFPRGAGVRYDGYREATGIDALGLDWTVPLGQAHALQARGPVQGNLDPLRLVAGGRALDEGVGRVLETLGDGPLVFNLGHGIGPETPVAHVEEMLKRIRG